MFLIYTYMISKNTPYTYTIYIHQLLYMEVYNYVFILYLISTYFNDKTIGLDVSYSNLKIFSPKTYNIVTLKYIAQCKTSVYSIYIYMNNF